MPSILSDFWILVLNISEVTTETRSRRSYRKQESRMNWEIGKLRVLYLVGRTAIQRERGREERYKTLKMIEKAIEKH